MSSIVDWSLPPTIRVQSLAILQLLCAACSALLLAACASVPREVKSDHPLTVLVSIDGFRADYLDRGVTPNLTTIAAEGLRVRALTPSFPSLTFPNHYTLVTGLHPDRHGIVGNRMVDPAIPGEFRLSDRAQVMDRRWWDGAEPLWVTAEKAGVRTATMFWPGSDAPIGGVRPGQWVPFQQSLSSQARVDIALAWLTMPAEERPAFMTLYFDSVDTAGHEHGPVSPEVDAALKEVDGAIGRLRDGIAAKGLTANVVVTADHGMTATSADRLIILDDLIDLSRARLLDGGPLASVTPAEGYAPALETALLRPHPHMSCWRKRDIPARLAYGRHRRITPYVCVAEAGWLIVTREGLTRVRSRGGAHGYDPEHPDMAAFLVASGPAFRRGAVVERARSVDVYGLLGRLVGVASRPSDGDPKAFASGVLDE